MRNTRREHQRRGDAEIHNCNLAQAESRRIETHFIKTTLFISSQFVIPQRSFRIFIMMNIPRIRGQPMRTTMFRFDNAHPMLQLNQSARLSGASEPDHTSHLSSYSCLLESRKAETVYLLCMMGICGFFLPAHCTISWVAPRAPTPSVMIEMIMVSIYHMGIYLSESLNLRRKRQRCEFVKQKPRLVLPRELI